MKAFLTVASLLASTSLFSADTLQKFVARNHNTLADICSCAQFAKANIDKEEFVDKVIFAFSHLQKVQKGKASLDLDAVTNIPGYGRYGLEKIGSLLNHRNKSLGCMIKQAQKTNQGQAA